MKKKLLVSIAASFFMNSCSGLVSKVLAEDIPTKDEQNETSAQSIKRLLQELGYDHEGVQANGKVTKCIVEDTRFGSGWGTERFLQLEVQALYEESIAKSGQKQVYGVSQTKQNYNNGTLCIVYPVTFKEIEEKTLAALTPEQRKRRLCDNELEQKNNACDSTKEGLALNQCTAQLGVINERLGSIYKRKTMGYCGKMGSLSLLDDEGREIDRLWREIGSQLSYAEKELCAAEAKAEYTIKSQEAEKMHLECIKPFKAVYDSCKETARSIYLGCLQK